ncbi:nitroreductase family protein [Paenibacillus aceris]|uniref:Oxidoreductase (Fatty acid repression mutant protein) n=1 Tax=Paenibacillus aceris TaxID=869555 RepID=A0ABS4I2L5_9BACL|nr:nitroreductase family protein [Paenibacillus aceris]MBP1965148.1 putative oxidoreductase (fatty acid repression mutant protein) [Paenibacillus aceris]NHW33129.1 nitroreductase family protein [Paenibacillus aceris]
MSNNAVEKSNAFLMAVKERRTYYGLSKGTVISNERIQEIVNEAVKHTPSAFNSQSARVVVLFGDQSDKLWSITKETLRKIVPAGSFAPTEERINGFSNGSGTVLFFEDQSVVEGLQAQFAAYAENFPIWSNQSSGMLQLVIWTALEQEGLGASLQHYNPLINDEVAQTWNIPSEWKLIAQMPFGKPTFVPGDKEFQSLEDRVRFI